MSALAAATSAGVHGPRWGARAGDWAAFAARVSAPAWTAVADAAGVGPGTRVLDVGCGSGEFCRMAGQRGAVAAGIDAGEGMVRFARRLAPAADLRVGAMEQLPWPDAAFDLVTGFNAFPFAADPVAALTEARRATRKGGLVAICNWGPSDLPALLRALLPLLPPGVTPPPRPPAVPAQQEQARQAGLTPLAVHEIAAPFTLPDLPTLERALLSTGGAAPAIAHAGEPAVRLAIAEAAVRFRRPGGSYHFDNTFTAVLTMA